MVRFDARRFAFEAALSSLELGSPELPVQSKPAILVVPLFLIKVGTDTGAVRGTGQL